MKKISRISSVLALAISFAAPIITFAAFNSSQLQGYKDTLVSIINDILVPAIMSVAFLVFMWGVYKYFFWKGESETERATGRTLILYGVIGFVIIACVWGIVAIFSSTLGLSAGNMPNPPTFGNTSSQSSSNAAPLTGAGVTPYTPTSGGVYPTAPTNGTCPAGQRLSNGYCINGCTTADRDDCESVAGNTYDMTNCTCLHSQ